LRFLGWSLRSGCKEVLWLRYRENGLGLRYVGSIIRRRIRQPQGMGQILPSTSRRHIGW
jgi:hypothetical protein